MHLITLVSESISLWYGGFKVLSWARKCKIKKFACACQILKWANCHGNSICMFCWVSGYHIRALDLSERLGMADSCSIEACWHQPVQHVFDMSYHYMTKFCFYAHNYTCPYMCEFCWDLSNIVVLLVAPATSTAQIRRHLPKRVTSTDQCVSMTIHTSQLFRI